jgi:transcriptional regulator with XRE-family HTH domain
MMKIVSQTHKKFGERLKELRSKNNFTQEDLADKVGVDRSYMGFLERGEKNPTLEKLTLIAKAFKISLSELFKGL